MPLFSDRPAQVGQIKALNIGASGSGKTGGSLPFLANAGYNLRILDFDGGLQIIGQYLTPEARKRVYYEVLNDKFITRLDGNMDWQEPPMAFVEGAKLLNHWKVKDKIVNGETVPGYDLGSVTNWGTDTILVIDSLTSFGNACMRFVLTLTKANIERKVHPYPQDWGEVQNRMSLIFEFLRSEAVKCHVIVNCHIRRVGGGGMQPQEVAASKGSPVKDIIWREVDSPEGKGFPWAPGKQLPPKVPEFFNTMLIFYTDDATGERMISTVPRDNIDAKTPAPKDLHQVYSVKDGGYLKIWNTILGVNK